MSEQRTEKVLCDPKSVELAEHFMQDADLEPLEYNELRDSLAGAIQLAVESWFDDNDMPSQIAGEKL